jgi:hypothetical protein
MEQFSQLQIHSKASYTQPSLHLSFNGDDMMLQSVNEILHFKWKQHRHAKPKRYRESWE